MYHFFDIKFSIISEKISNHISGENYVAVSYILFHGIYVFCIFNFRERIAPSIVYVKKVAL